MDTDESLGPERPLIWTGGMLINTANRWLNQRERES